MKREKEDSPGQRKLGKRTFLGVTTRSKLERFTGGHKEEVEFVERRVAKGRERNQGVTEEEEKET